MYCFKGIKNGTDRRVVSPLAREKKGGKRKTRERRDDEKKV
jgi:hypothetical protein